MARCKHLNVKIDEEFLGSQFIKVENGQKVFDGDGGGGAAPTGRYNVHCKDCGLRRSYFGKNKPIWLTAYLFQSTKRDWTLDLEPSPASDSGANEAQNVNS